MPFSRAVAHVARRETRLFRRSHAAHGGLLLLLGLAWLPALLLPLRSGSLGIASLEEVTPLALALGGVCLPLVAVLAGADALASELEDGSLPALVTLSLSRSACFAGKCLGRACILGAAYVVAFASAGLAMAAVHGRSGRRDCLAVSAAGLLLALSCGGVGAALGASGRGRVRAFGAALGAWALLVFALDGLLLAGIVTLAPAPPAEVGRHGHAELAAASRPLPIHDPHARHAAAEPRRTTDSGAAPWLLALNPVDLFRLGALTAGPGLRQRLAVGLPGAGRPWLALGVGWLLWLALPLAWGARGFGKAVLT